MPRSSYYRGRIFEYRVKYKLRRMGFLVVRCASSRPFDLIAFKKGLPPIFVECKAAYSYQPFTVQRQKELAESVGGIFLLVDLNNFNRLEEIVKEIEKKCNGGAGASAEAHYRAGRVGDHSGGAHLADPRTDNPGGG